MTGYRITAEERREALASIERLRIKLENELLTRDDVVRVSWRDCSCEWWTKTCDEMHTRTGWVRRGDLHEDGK